MCCDTIYYCTSAVFVKEGYKNTQQPRIENQISMLQSRNGGTTRVVDTTTCLQTVQHIHFSHFISKKKDQIYCFEKPAYRLESFQKAILHS